jgi:hypothetical protein
MIILGRGYVGFRVQELAAGNASNAATPLHLPPTFTAHGSGPGGAEVQNPFSPTTFILALSIFVKVPPKKVPKKES